MIPLALFSLSGCIAIGGGADRIVAADLARAMPGFEGASPDRPIALAPVPGVQRIFRVPELQRIAIQLNAAAAPERDVCFERPLAPLDPARMLAAMQAQLPHARIEIVEHSRFPAPEGEIEFPLAGLRRTPAGGAWNGAVRYGGTRRWAIWATVKAQVTASRVVAAEPLLAGRIIEAAQLRVEVRDEFPSSIVYAASIEETAGGVPRRAVARGVPIDTQWLVAAKDVHRGDTVRVSVHSGAAALELEGKAETGGSAGQNITVLNPASKRRFQARVEGKGKVTVAAGAVSTPKGTP